MPPRAMRVADEYLLGRAFSAIPQVIPDGGSRHT
jgi:hypothetical protein